MTKNLKVDRTKCGSQNCHGLQVFELLVALLLFSSGDAGKGLSDVQFLPASIHTLLTSGEAGTLIFKGIPINAHMF